MIKRILIIILIFLFKQVSAQEIKSNSTDPFTNERTIETTMASVKQGLSSGFGISYTSINNNYYLNVVGYGSSFFSESGDDKFWLVLEDGNVVHFNEPARAEGEEMDPTKNVFIYHYFARMNDIEILKNKKVSIVRISSATGKITDIKVSSKTAKAILKLNDIFFNEVNK